MAQKIIVHEKALAHLSRGLYRSPASALRELVSNAWDANATEVRLNTNYPNFMQLSVQDNGDGFSRQEFEDLMGGGIGNSQKRPSQKALKHNRPIIGRLGIGMLGIAQICGGFYITSNPRKGQGFRARVHLYDLIKERLDRDDQELVRDEVVDVGEFEFENFDPQESRFGTTIIADDIHPTFVRSFQNSLKNEGYKEPPRDWSKALKIVAKFHSLQEMGDYWRLLWELAAATPIPYLDHSSLPKGLVAEEQERLLGYHFKVNVDGVDLYKPVHLKRNPGGYTATRISPEKIGVYGKTLRFHGYVVVQEGTQLRPDELRGIMVRIKNVGIGYYDPSLLDYRFNEGPRSRWVTGEIFVDEGLEDALNIDRDSFNRFHPEFKEIQNSLHRLLRENVFPASYRKIDVRSREKASAKTDLRLKHLSRVVSSHIDKSVEIVQQKRQLGSHPQVKIFQDRGTKMQVSIPDANSVKTKKANRLLASSILTVFELAVREKDDEKQRDTFTRLLLQLLSEW